MDNILHQEDDNAVELDTLIAAAWNAREQAYAPYSGFRVGAALLCEDGAVFTGANVENISFGLTMCAERVAVGNAVSSGKHRFRRLVVAADSHEAISPCGACRQVLAEFAADLEIITVTAGGKRFNGFLATLLPRPATGILDRRCST